MPNGIFWLEGRFMMVSASFASTISIQLIQYYYVCTIITPSVFVSLSVYNLTSKFRG